MQQIWDDTWDALGGLLFMALTALVFAFFILLLMSVFWLVKALRGADEQAGAGAAPPMPLFGAPPGSRWLLAYDYWLFRLEQVTGIEFNTSPARLLAGCVIISAGPALMAGVILDVLDPAPGAGWMGGLTLVGVLIGTLTGRRQAAPLVGWFSAPAHSSAGGGARPGFLDLGDDD